ncbi:MAG TPA: hypothetical protein VIH57_03295, partial [Bacteroidales bacterium]
SWEKTPGFIANDLRVKRKVKNILQLCKVYDLVEETYDPFFYNFARSTTLLNVPGFSIERANYQVMFF